MHFLSAAPDMQLQPSYKQSHHNKSSAHAAARCNSTLRHRNSDNQQYRNCRVSIASEADIHDIIVKLKGLASDSGNVWAEGSKASFTSLRVALFQPPALRIVNFFHSGALCHPAVAAQKHPCLLHPHP